MTLYDAFIAEKQELEAELRAVNSALAAMNRSEGWFGKAMDIVEALAGWEGTGEDLRFLIEAQIGNPHTPKLWGTLVNTAAKEGLIEKVVGDYRYTIDPKSHSRNIPVWRTCRE